MAISGTSRLRGFSHFLLACGVLAASALAQDGAPPAPPPTPVRVAEVREERLAPRQRVFGELHAVRRTTVAAEESGILVELAVEDGQRVEKGAVVARLDPARLRLAIASNDASLVAARATRTEREAVAARAVRDLELLERAAAQGGTNPREVANATSEVAVTRAQVGQAEAAIGVLERQHELLAERLKDLAIVAPFSGTVTRRHTDLGAWVPEGGAVIDLVATDQLEAWFEVPQEHLGAALALAAASAKEPSRPVPIEIELAPGQPISAVAMRVVPEIDPRTRSFRAICRIEAGDRALAAGLALTAFVASGELAPRLVLPKDAVLRGDAGPYVFVVRGGVAMPAPVRIAFPLGDSVVVEPGAVRAGESVVTEGNERLMPMTPVAPSDGSERSK